MSDRVVLDASVVLALLHDEPLGSFERRGVPGSTISTVNLSEVLTKLIANGMPYAAARDATRQLDLEIVPFNEDVAVLTAQLWPETRRAGLSLGDRACIALGLSLDAVIVTADRAWRKLDLGPRLLVIR